MAQITYQNKSAINVNADVAAVNKVSADDMNEIKTVVNNNYNEFQLTQSFCVAGISANFTTSSTADAILPLNTTINSSGSISLDTENNAIQIGSANIHYVRVSGMIRWTNNLTANQRFNIAIQKNSDLVASNTLRSSTGTNQSQNIPSLIIPVSNGDKIYLIVRSFDSSGNTVGSPSYTTFLQVEAVS